MNTFYILLRVSNNTLRAEKFKINLPFEEVVGPVLDRVAADFQNSATNVCGIYKTDQEIDLAARTFLRTRTIDNTRNARFGGDLDDECVVVIKVGCFVKMANMRGVKTLREAFAGTGYDVSYPTEQELESLHPTFFQTEYFIGRYVTEKTIGLFFNTVKLKEKSAKYVTPKYTPRDHFIQAMERFARDGECPSFLRPVLETVREGLNGEIATEKRVMEILRTKNMKEHLQDSCMIANMINRANGV